MKKTILMLVAVVSLFACRQKKVELSGDEDVQQEVSTTPQQNCYQYINGKDTAMFTLNTDGKKATGDLSYSWFQKDKNIGTITGEFHGDTIIANYNFTSEGKQSMRQVVFLKQGDKLTEGVGEVELDGANTLYRDLSMLTFEETVVLTKVPCK